MKTQHLLLVVLVFLLSNTISAQNILQPLSPQSYSAQNPVPQKDFCRTEITPENVKMENERDQVAYQQLLKRYLNNNNRAATEFRMQVHIVRTSAGTGGASYAAVQAEFTNYVNPYFAALGWTFVECGTVNYIDSDTYYTLSGTAEGNTMSAANNVANVFNIYYVGDADGACGWARFPWNFPEDYVVIDNACVSNKSTTVHEVGHYFGLYHTHETAFGAENVTRSAVAPCYDCLVDGDLLCDTDADPRLSAAGVTVTAAPGCVYSSALTDGCGVSYTPNTSFIMSYAPKACRTIWSPLQQAKMLAIYPQGAGAGRSYLNTISCLAPPNNLCAGAVALSCGSDVTIDITNASDTDNPNVFCGTSSNGTEPGVWYKYTAASNTEVTLSTCNAGSNYDTKLQVFSGSCGSLSCVNGDDDDFGCGLSIVRSTVIWCATSGTTYYIYLYGFGGSTGTAQLTLSCNNVPPVITCPSNITVNNNAGLCSAIVNFSASATDDCPGTTIAYSHASGSSFPVGVTTVTATATDAGGLSASCSFTITVVDNENPTINCPANIVVNNDPGKCCAVVQYAVTGSDNCPGYSIFQTGGLGSGSCFPVGVTTNVWQITDAAGNTATCSFTVTVNDNEGPLLSCSDTMLCLDSLGGVKYIYSILDNACIPYDNTITVNNPTVKSYDYDFNGTTTGATADGVLYLFAKGDLDFEGQPEGHPEGGGGGGEAWIILDENYNYIGQIGPKQPQCGDISDSILLTFAQLNLWAADGIITFRARATSQVNVDLCAGDYLTLQLVYCQENAGYEYYASDNCGVDTSYISQDTFTCADLGLTAITYTAIDIHGNTSTCESIINVRDKIPPYAEKHPYPIFWLDTFGQAAIFPIDIIDSIWDNCGIDTTELDRVLLNCNDFGTILVTLTVTDLSGNTSTCIGPIGVQDSIAPIAGCKDTTLYLDANGNAWINTWDLESGSWDNCSYGVNNQLLHFTWSHIGANTVTVLIYDPQNNMDSCYSTVTIIDTLNPIITCVDMMVSNDPGLCSATVIWAVPTATPASAVISQIGGPFNGSSLPVGVTVVTYTATNPSGNSSSCSILITVKDTEPPVIKCPSDRIRYVLPGRTGRFVKYNTPTATDNCGVASVNHVSGGFSGSFFGVGSTTVTWIATDIHGNTSTCSFDVIVLEAETMAIEDNNMEDGGSKGTDQNAESHLRKIDPLVGAANLKLYPNPTTGYFVLEVERTGYSGKLTVEIYDLLGRRIFAKSDGFDSYLTLEIDLQDQNSGQFMVHLRLGDMVLTRKLILIK